MSSEDGTEAGDPVLDEVLGGFVKDVAAGRTPDLAAVLPDRPDLRERIAGMWALAQRIAPRRPARRPEVGGYVLEEEIGRGGMGHVWRARHLRLGRVVALKLLPHRFANARARERFERESRAVAKLEHPGIVRVYESGGASDGASEDDQPWFAMELVTGRTLAAVIEALRTAGRPARELAAADLAKAAACDPAPSASQPAARATSYPAAAALLLADVADALHFAHTRGVVHRDVKPSNVIVRAADGRPLLFDFGLAGDESEASLTLTGDFMGTPHYASPEQAAGATKDADARSDIWSLGASLYELITLSLPFVGPSTHEILSAVRTREPAGVRTLNPAVGGDLATVVHRALEKDPARRYRTAADFAADLRAAVEGRPIAARRVGTLGRIRRWAGRNRAAAAAVALGFALCVGTPTALLIQQTAATRRVTEERNRADGVTQFLLEAFRAADPDADGRDVKVADVLERAAKTAETRFADDPATRAAVLDAVGSTLYNLNLHSESIPPLRSAAAAYALAGDLGNEVRTLAGIGFALGIEGRLDEAEALLRGAIRKAAPLARNHPSRAEAEVDLAQVVAEAGRHDDAIAILGELRAALPPDDAVGLRAGHELSLALSYAGKNAEAIPMLRDVLARRRVRDGETGVNTLASAALLGQLLSEEGQLDEAIPVLESVVAAHRRMYGESAPDTVSAMHNLAGAMQRAQRLEDARVLQARAAELAPSAFGPSSFMPSLTLWQLGEIEVALGDRAAAIRHGRESLAATRLVERDAEHVARAVLLLVPQLIADGQIATAAEIWEAEVGVSPDVFASEPGLQGVRTSLADALDAAGDAARASAVRASPAAR